MGKTKKKIKKAVKRAVRRAAKPAAAPPAPHLQPFGDLAAGTEFTGTLTGNKLVKTANGLSKIVSLGARNRRGEVGKIVRMDTTTQVLA